MCCDFQVLCVGFAKADNFKLSSSSLFCVKFVTGNRRFMVFSALFVCFYIFKLFSSLSASLALFRACVEFLLARRDG